MAISSHDKNKISWYANLLLSTLTFCRLLVTRFFVGGLRSRGYLLMVCWCNVFTTTILPVCSSMENRGNKYYGTDHHVCIANNGYLWTADVCCTVRCRVIDCCQQTYICMYIWYKLCVSTQSAMATMCAFNVLFIANLLLSVKVKEFWRSVRIWQSYGKKFKWHLFSGHGV